MESTAPASSPATTPVTPTSLAAALALVPDPRRQASVTYPLPALLNLAVAAILCDQESVLAIAEWGARQHAPLLAWLGFPEGDTPCQSTLQRLFCKLDSQALSTALQAHFSDDAASDERGEHGVAIDGKAQCGRRQYEPEGPVVHALAAFCHEQGIVLASEPIARGAQKAEAELTVAPTLIERIDWHGRVLTGDALFCQRHLCQQVVDAGGDYLLLVKANQPKLHDAIALLFEEPAVLLDRREVRTIDQGHGRTAEVRHLIASTDLNDYLDWPALAQVFRVERTWWEQGKHKGQVRYGISSLPHQVGTAQRLLALKRGHWGIENRLHRAKDVGMGEDASLIHSGQGPTIFSILRDTTLSVLRRAGYHRITAQRRHNGQYPEEAAPLLFHPAPTRA